MSYIIGYDAWKKVFISDQSLKHNTWIYVKLDNDQELFLRHHNEWLTLSSYCKNNNANIKSVGLRYRSHQIQVNTESAEGVYLVRSVKGEFGGNTKQCFTIGLLNDGVVDKTMWLTPELVEESKIRDKVEDCFQEALIYFKK
jgi:hypothetical protein